MLPASSACGKNTLVAKGFRQKAKQQWSVPGPEYGTHLNLPRSLTTPKAHTEGITLYTLPREGRCTGNWSIVYILMFIYIAWFPAGVCRRGRGG